LRNAPLTCPTTCRSSRATCWPCSAERPPARPRWDSRPQRNMGFFSANVAFRGKRRDQLNSRWRKEARRASFLGSCHRHCSWIWGNFRPKPVGMRHLTDRSLDRACRTHQIPSRRRCHPRQSAPRFIRIGRKEENAVKNACLRGGCGCCGVGASFPTAEMRTRYIVGIIRLIIGLIFFRNTLTRGGAFAALVGCLLAVLAIVMLFRAGANRRRVRIPGRTLRPGRGD
jgi:hypothetical protein